MEHATGSSASFDAKTTLSNIYASCIVLRQFLFLLTGRSKQMTLTLAAVSAIVGLGLGPNVVTTSPYISETGLPWQSGKVTMDFLLQPHPR
jgi:hypothetical protein